MVPHAPLQSSMFTFSIFRQSDALKRPCLQSFGVVHRGDVDATDDFIAVSENETWSVVARRAGAVTDAVAAAWAPAPHGGRVRELGESFLRTPQCGRITSVFLVEHGEVCRPPQDGQTIQRQGRPALGGAVVDELVARDDVPLGVPELVDADDVAFVGAHGANVLTSAIGRKALEDARPVAVAATAGAFEGSAQPLGPEHSEDIADVSREIPRGAWRCVEDVHGTFGQNVSRELIIDQPRLPLVNAVLHAVDVLPRKVVAQENGAPRGEPKRDALRAKPLVVRQHDKVDPFAAVLHPPDDGWVVGEARGEVDVEAALVQGTHPTDLHDSPQSGRVADVRKDTDSVPLDALKSFERPPENGEQPIISDLRQGMTVARSDRDAARPTIMRARQFAHDGG